MIDRGTLIKLLRTSLSVGRADFARFAANDWLSLWPGDAPVQTYLARAEMELGLIDAAIERVQQAIAIDPELIDAYQVFASALRSKGNFDRANDLEACARILQKDPLNPESAPDWALNLQEAMDCVRRSQFDTAAAKASIALTADPSFILPTYTLLSIQRSAGQLEAAVAVARNAYKRWPECVAFLLIAGEDFLANGEDQDGIALLHTAARNDPSGTIAGRILGHEHAYQDLWPVKLETELSRPIPASVASNLGDNQLSVPTVHHKIDVSLQKQKTRPSEPIIPVENTDEVQKPIAHVSNEDQPLPKPQAWEAFKGPNVSEVQAQPGVALLAEPLQEIDREFRHLAQRLNARKRTRDEDGRSPAYVVLSSRSHLLQQCEEDGFGAIDERVERLIERIRRRYGWTAYKVYVDDPKTLAPFNLSPVDPANAWQIKLRLTDLDRALASRGEMIGAVLIVGGNGIIPFHLLPNPTDDDDEVIPSDNPYATSDENYFMPEWPVGRLPGENEPELILNQLKYALQNHEVQAPPRRNIWRLFRVFGFGFVRLLSPKVKTLGYSASIWRKSSFAVFKTIGDPKNLITSPPVEATRLPSNAMRPSGFSYFNLHGLEDTPEWYGQRDPMRDRNTSVEFPIALRPTDVINSGRAPKVVFTEACYGANSIGKTSESALSLKFLNSGSRAVIGSTKISYGSVRPPLIAADLLGQLFWSFLNKRLPVGEALRRAKMKLAAEMHQRQGYLDGEDQKTLISFVLYGDPLYLPSPTLAQPGEKTVVRRINRPTVVKTACALGGPSISEHDLSPSTMKRIEHIVAQYLPGMQQAVCTIHNQHVQCRGEDHACPSQHFDQKSVKQSPSGSMVITLSKHIADGHLHHPHFARLTLDSEGKVMKLAVSR